MDIPEVEHHRKPSAQPIPVPQTDFLQQGLKQSLFNPSKQSPPDTFMTKLTARLHGYYHESQSAPSCNKSDTSR